MSTVFVEKIYTPFYSLSVPRGTRSPDQVVQAFSLSTDLQRKAQDRADEMGMTLSGYFRYALAKELGHNEAEAKDISLHVSITRRRAARYPSHTPGSPMLNEQGLPFSSAAASAAQSTGSASLVPAQNPPPSPKPSPGAAAPSAHKSAPTHGIGKRSKKKPSPPA